MHFAAWLTKQLSAGVTLPTGNDLLLEYICAKDHGNLKVSPQFLQLAERLDRGDLVLIFDGMDEAGKQLERISVYIGQFLCNNYRGRMIFSSRESLFDEKHFASSRWTILQIQPLTQDMQDDVVRRRFGNAEQAESFLVQQKASDNLLTMGTNPLLLALQIGVFKMREEQLPERRTELYRIGTRSYPKTMTIQACRKKRKKNGN
eukprot:COSAG05_NODE_106_length_18750_cov_677.083105_20_plen_204_part_00